MQGSAVDGMVLVLPVDGFTVITTSTNLVFKHKNLWGFFAFRIDSCSYQNDCREETTTRFEGSVSVT